MVKTLVMVGVALVAHAGVGFGDQLPAMGAPDVTGETLTDIVAPLVAFPA